MARSAQINTDTVSKSLGWVREIAGIQLAFRSIRMGIEMPLLGIVQIVIYGRKDDRADRNGLKTNLLFSGYVFDTFQTST
jgi:hypothetical protein